jgi:hypothetical protein
MFWNGIFIFNSLFGRQTTCWSHHPCTTVSNMCEIGLRHLGWEKPRHCQWDLLKWKSWIVLRNTLENCGTQMLYKLPPMQKTCKVQGSFWTRIWRFQHILGFIQGCTNPSILCTISTLQHPHEQTISINSVHNFNLAISSSYWNRQSSLHITVLLSLIVCGGLLDCVLCIW